MEQTKELKGTANEGLNPIIEFTIMNQKKYTKPKKDIAPTAVTYWGEHIFFELKGLVSNKDI